MAKRVSTPPGAVVTAVTPEPPPTTGVAVAVQPGHTVQRDRVLHGPDTILTIPADDAHRLVARGVVRLAAE
jgi:hypothetical protein